MLELMKRDSTRLFEEAGKVASSKPTLFSAPIAVDTRCETKPSCLHCSWRSRTTINPDNLRKTELGEVAAKAKLVEELGIPRLHLASGWAGVDLNDHFYECVRVVKKVTNLELYGVFGAISKAALRGLREAGIDGYWCPIEIPNEKLYQKIRPGDRSLRDRLETLETAKSLGLKTWSGFLFGVGETQTDIADGVEMLRDLDIDSFSLMPFTPCPYTKMQGRSPANPLKWARAIAAIVLYMPSWNLFADVSLAAWGARAGANGFSPIIISDTPSNLENLRELRNLMKRIHEN